MISVTEHELISIRRRIHKQPEPGWCEYKTSSLVLQELRKLDYEIVYGKDLLGESEKLGLEDKEVSEYFFEKAKINNTDLDTLENIKNSNTAIIATLDCGKGPHILLRFDMDALKLSETTNTTHKPSLGNFSSENKNYMHACGHDAHTAIGICIAKELQANKEHINAKVSLLFQPAEEGLRGAAALIDNSIFTDIDYAFGFHLWAHIKTGKIICGTDGQLASTKFNLKIYGKASHAGLDPEKGINALIASADIIKKLYELYELYKDYVKFNIGKIKGGESRNIICPYVELELETRSINSDSNNLFYNKCIAIIEKITNEHKCIHEIIIKGYADAANSNIELAQKVKTIACKNPYFTDIVLQEQAGGNSEDFTSIMNKVQKNKSLATFVGIGASIGAGGHHTVDFDIDEKTLKHVVDLFTDICISY